ncbi:hypothetical protein BV22DRAFT_1128233 [Leucogyrophana mollusca]|uniref:Uncharacterized protein n=1 Tax=Leucogyrophana mollusca TaxID=85980 RepID=A0ACB8BNA1_9AGAM|nr:hypothetical protein BV22DRAFT_1128233 [Leucogyrophana mollusca]
MVEIVPSSPTLPPSTPPPQSSSSAQNTPDQILNKLRTSPNGYYAATPNLADLAEFFLGGRSGDVLVAKHSSKEEFILRGLFEISRSDFFFTPDGNFDPANDFNAKLADVKLACRLIGANHSTFDFSKQDFPSIVNNIHSLEKLIHKEKGYEIHSAVQSTGGIDALKLSHALFTKKITKTAAKGDDNDNSENKCSEHASETAKESTSDDTKESTDEARSEQDSTHSSDSMPNLGPAFELSTWPVANRVKPELLRLLSSHVVEPLPVWESNGVLIPPQDYETKLMGATVEVHMALVHHRIKSSRRHVFNLVIREMIVRRKPANMPASPLKRHRLDNGPASELIERGKGKERRV